MRPEVWPSGRDARAAIVFATQIHTDTQAVNGVELQDTSGPGVLWTSGNRPPQIDAAAYWLCEAAQVHAGCNLPRN